MPSEGQASVSRLEDLAPVSLQGENTPAAMEVEHPVNALSSSPLGSSPNVKSSISGRASSQSGGSSFDTASASAHLERYDVPWTISELGVMRNIRPRTRSYSAILEWHTAPWSSRPHLMRNARPLAGASRRRLIRQIQELTKDKAELEAQLASIVMGGPVSPSLGKLAVTRGATRSPPRNVVEGATGTPLSQISNSSKERGEASSMEGLTEPSVPTSDESMAGPDQ